MALTSGANVAVDQRVLVGRLAEEEGAHRAHRARALSASEGTLRERGSSPCVTPFNAARPSLKVQGPAADLVRLDVRPLEPPYNLHTVLLKVTW